MSLNPLPHWALTNLNPAFYDTESGNAIEQTARVYAKMNELVAECNNFIDKINTEIEKFEKSVDKNFELFATELRQEFQDFIDIIDLKIKSQDTVIDNAVDYMKTNLTETVNLLIEKMFDEGRIDAKALKDYVTPQMYGAMGDGVHDDTEAFQAAFENSKIVFVPKGYYKISSAITIPVGGALVGLSSEATTIHSVSNECVIMSTGSKISNIYLTGLSDITETEAFLLKVTGSNCIISNMRFGHGYNHVAFNGSAHSVSNVYSINANNGGIHFFNVNDVYLSNVFVLGCKGKAIALYHRCEAINVVNLTALNCELAFYIATNTRFCKFTNCFFDSANTRNDIMNATDIIFNNCWFSSRTAIGGSQHFISECKNIVFNGCDFVNNGDTALFIGNNNSHIKVLNCTFDSNNGNCIYITGTPFALSIIGNTFSKNYDSTVSMTDIRISDTCNMTKTIIALNIFSDSNDIIGGASSEYENINNVTM